MIKKWAISVDFYNLLQVVIYWPKWHKTDHKRVKTTYLLAKTNPMAYLLAKITEIIQMSEYTNFANIQKSLEVARLSDFQSSLLQIHLDALGGHLTHQLHMAVIESQDPKVFEAVKLIANKMGVNLDVERLSLLVKGD